VRMVVVERDKYGRMVVVDGRSVNVEMVRAGIAYHYARYSGNCGVRGAIEMVEDEAKSSRVGVWAGDYRKPWDYRKMSR
jgi:micrococcal nuclease